MKHPKDRIKYTAARRIFNSLLGVSSGDETLHLTLDIFPHVLLLPGSMAMMRGTRPPIPRLDRCDFFVVVVLNLTNWPKIRKSNQW